VKRLFVFFCFFFSFFQHALFDICGCYLRKKADFTIPVFLFYYFYCCYLDSGNFICLWINICKRFEEKKNNSTTKISNHCIYHAVHYNLTCVNLIYLENENKNKYVSCYRYIKLISRVIFISKCYLKLTFCVISFIIWQTNARNTPIWLLKDPLPKFHDENKLIILFHFKISIMSNGNLSKISCTCISCRVLLMVHVLTNTTF